ncbi:MAG: PQQ-dependent sugar dehydrogenase [Chloroflexi bacterium]|nr:PQQ-dependent sugar dehydrogenase [Chloroflexota bacterium]
MNKTIPLSRIALAFSLACLASACSGLSPFATEPLPTLNAAVLTLTAQPSPGKEASPTPVWPTAIPKTVVPASVTPASAPTPTPVPTRTSLPTWTLTPEASTPSPALAASLTPRPPASSTPGAVSTSAPAAAHGAPPVNRYNDVTGRVDAAGYRLQLIASGIPNALSLTNAGDGSGRLFIASQDGRIFIYQNGTLLPQPFLDIRPLVVPPSDEMGFLGLAFHPNYKRNGYFYVHYMSPDLYNIVERYTVSASNPNAADPNSRLTMLRMKSIDGMHNGGQLAFGPFDGYLYVGMGDGGGAGDPNNWAQDLSALRGKILRLDVNGGTPYAIPPSNPFVGQSPAAPEIWAYGFRNPWRFSFDRARGDLWIADVGQENTEEINFQEVFKGAGLNYGWALMEGLTCYINRPCENAAITTPLQYYFHENGRCAVIGGYVYRGPSLPGLTGAYLYGDYCTGEVWAMRFNAAGDAFFADKLLDTHLPISSFGEDEAGEIYVLALSGEVYRIVK